MSLTFKLLGTTLGALMLSVASPDASAYAITYNEGNYTLCTTGTENSNTAFNLAAAGCGGTTEVYKHNVEGIPLEEGSFASSYSTAFFNSPTDPSDATITYDGGSSIFCSTTEKCLLGLKDGNANPAFYIFDISDWDGTSSIVMTGFWPDRGAISHVSIFSGGDGNDDGGGPGGNPVPEPGSLALVGLGLLGAAVARRRRV